MGQGMRTDRANTVNAGVWERGWGHERSEQKTQLIRVHGSGRAEPSGQAQLTRVCAICNWTAHIAKTHTQHICQNTKDKHFELHPALRTCNLFINQLRLCKILVVIRCLGAHSMPFFTHLQLVSTHRKDTHNQPAKARKINILNCVQRYVHEIYV